MIKSANTKFLQDLNSFSKYLDERIIKKLILKEKNGEIVEKLDI